MTVRETTHSSPPSEAGRFRLSRVTVGWRAEEALLVGVSEEFLPGEMVAMTGPSGCGKSTLLRTMAGLMDPLEGELLLGGSPPSTYGWPAYRRQVLLVHQQPILFQGTVRENLQRPFQYRSAGTASFQEQTATARLTRLGLPRGILDASADRLSVGEQQRVCLVRALMVEPTILLLDEPTSAVDPATAAEMETVMAEEVRRRRMTVILVSHQPDRSPAWSGRCLDLEAYRP